MDDNRAKKVMGRGLSQVLYNYLPGKTFDIQGGKNIAIVSKVKGKSIMDLKDTGKIFGLIKESLENWGKEYRSGFDNLDTLRDRYVFEKPMLVDFDIFPLVFKCPSCKRVYNYRNYSEIERKNPDLVCLYGNDCKGKKELRQVYQVAIHHCGKIEGLFPIQPEMCECRDWKKNIILDDRRSQKIKDFRWVCTKCGNEASLTYFCPDCIENNIMTVIPHRAGKSFYVHYIRCVDVPQSGYLDSWKDDVKRYLNIDMESSITINQDLLERLDKYPEDIKKELLKDIEEANNNNIDFDDLKREDFYRLHEYLEIMNRKYEMGTITLIESIKNANEYNPMKARVLERFKIKYEEMGIQEISLISKFPVVTAVFGWTREDIRPEFPKNDGTINTTINSFRYATDTEGKTPIFVDNGECEALMFQIDPVKVVNWLRGNNITVDLESEDENSARLWIIQNVSPVSPYGNINQNDLITEYVYSLIHSMSHIFMKGISGISGFELVGLSEYLFPQQLAFVIYSNKTDFSIGGMHTLFETQLDQLRTRVLNDYRTCMHDPLCTQQGGACHACMHLPEIACNIFNRKLSRKYLYQQIDQKIDGFWKGIY